MIVIDLDGTLLNDEQQVTARTKRAIADAIEKGIQVVFASGRSKAGIMNAIAALNLEASFDYAICFNGANVINLRTQQSIVNNTLKGLDLQEIYSFARNQQGYFYAFDHKDIFTDVDNEFTTLEAMKNNLQVVKKDISTVRNDEEIYKIIIANAREALDELEKYIPADFYDKYSIVRSHDNNLELLHPSANKAEALKALANKLDIPLKEIIAFGDAGNDIGMLQIVGKGIAMGNAFEEVKEIAHYVTDSNNQDGIAKALDNLFYKSF